MSKPTLLYQRDQDLVPFTLEPFASEDVLQRLLADHPEILGQVLGGRWLLVAREMGVPDDTGALRWSVDHVFLDETGIPTLVEVKRREDSRIHREVVGQMLEYLANAAAFWTADFLKQTWESTSQVNGLDPGAVLAGCLTGENTPEEFWNRVTQNIAIGKFRCLFVADHLPRELVRIIDFLHRQMRPTEVMGIEIQLHRAENHQVVTAIRVGDPASPVARTPTRKGVGAKQWIREQIATVGSMRLEDGLAAGYTEGTLKTAMADLKNPKYCGPDGVLVLVRGEDGYYCAKG